VDEIRRLDDIRRLSLYYVKQVQAAEVAQQRTAVSSKCIQLYYTCSDRLLAIGLHLALSILFPPSFCDVSEARSYFASTIHGLLCIRSVAINVSSNVLRVLFPVLLPQHCRQTQAMHGTLNLKARLQCARINFLIYTLSRPTRNWLYLVRFLYFGLPLT
jgi:hypothetical protein